MIIKKRFHATGTTCESCANIICRQAKSVEGVIDANFDYASETGNIEYDDEKTDINEIFAAISKKGYGCEIINTKSNNKSKNELIKKSGIIIGVIGFLIIGYFMISMAETINIPSLDKNLGYGLLFLVGLLTGLHCITMCGGFVVGYSARSIQRKENPHIAHASYAIGKLISYTVIGAAFGLLGSIVAFTPKIRGIAGIIAGLFLMLYGLKMLNFFPSLRNLGIKFPKSIARFAGSRQSSNSHPLVIGLLNGLMIACGPLQAIYIMAAGTGSIVEGAKLLFIFAAGTLPAMIGFGYFTSFVAGNFTRKLLKASGIIVIILGILMLNNGLSLMGNGYDLKSMVTSVRANTQSNSISNDKKISDQIAESDGDYQTIHMNVTRYGWEPDTFVLQKDIPVKWVIDGQEITGCNNAIQVPQFNLQFDIRQGYQTIEFTPDKEGVIAWSCWMGMIPGTFIVKSDIDLSDTTEIEKIKEESLASAPPRPQSSCGCGG